MARQVCVLKRDLFVGVAHHWAVRVGEDFYEVSGTGMDEKIMTVVGPNGVVASADPKAQLPGTTLGTLKEHESGVKGTTTTSDKDIEAWIKDWVKKNPVYNFAGVNRVGRNCQHFSRSFFKFLTGKEFPITEDQKFKELVGYNDKKRKADDAELDPSERRARKVVETAGEHFEHWYKKKPSGAEGLAAIADIVGATAVAYAEANAKEYVRNFFAKGKGKGKGKVKSRPMAPLKEGN